MHREKYFGSNNTGLKLLKCTKDEVEVKILDEGSPDYSDYGL
jgi:hypothetical protein